MKKNSIIARYKGADGSKGYRFGHRYKLWMWEDLSVVHPGTGKKSVFIEEPAMHGSQVEYESTTAFLNNWTDVQMGLGLPEAAPNTKHTSLCILKAKDDEPIFVLRANDPTSPQIVGEWISLNLDKQPMDKLKGALLVAEQMMVWRKRNLDKNERYGGPCSVHP